MHLRAQGKLELSAVEGYLYYGGVCKERFDHTCNFYVIFFIISTVFVLCKLGNDSQKAVQLLQEEFCRNPNELLSSEDPLLHTDIKQDATTESKPCDVIFKDIAGGLHAWAKHIDKDFPIY